MNSTEKRTVYIAGPMTGLPEYNYPAFFEVEEFLLKSRELIEVKNPARNKRDHTESSWIDFMADGIEELSECDTIVLLPGWQNSRGARIEFELALGAEMDMYEWNPEEKRFYLFGKQKKEEATKQKEKPQSACHEAHSLVHGDRQNDYGSPVGHMERIGKLWGIVLEEWKKSNNEAITPEMVSLCMVALKLARETNKHKRDNLVDACGYLEITSMIHEEKASKESCGNDTKSCCEGDCKS